MLKDMQRKKYTSVVPHVEDESQLVGKEMPFLDLNSTYVQAGSTNSAMPKVVDQWPWQPRTNVLLDRFYAGWGGFNAGLRFDRVAVD